MIFSLSLEKICFECLLDFTFGFKINFAFGFENKFDIVFEKKFALSLNENLREIFIKKGIRNTIIKNNTLILGNLLPLKLCFMGFSCKNVYTFLRILLIYLQSLWLHRALLLLTKNSH